MSPIQIALLVLAIAGEGVDYAEIDTAISDALK